MFHHVETPRETPHLIDEAVQKLSFFCPNLFNQLMGYLAGLGPGGLDAERIPENERDSYLGEHPYNPRPQVAKAPLPNLDSLASWALNELS